MTIDLRSPLTLANSLRFPLQNADSRREIITGGLWLLLVPGFGWLLNMGHRICLVHNMHHGRPPWPAWNDRRELLRHGVYTLAGMVWYGWPGVSLLAFGALTHRRWAMVAGFALWAVAVVAIPGYMSHYCREFDRREIFNPLRALSRVAQGGLAYWKAWAIVFVALPLSFLGLLAGGVGFAFTSVWFWQTAAFSFATVFTQEFKLDRRRDD